MPLGAIKLNMSKAYDRQDRNFIFLVLRKFGFSEKWIQLHGQRFTTVFSSILINGKPSSLFKLKAGIR